MKTILLSSLAVAFLTSAHAAPMETAREEAAPTPAQESQVARSTTAASTEAPAVSVPSSDLQRRVEALEKEVTGLQIKELERNLAIGNPNSHPLWP